MASNPRDAIREMRDFSDAIKRGRQLSIRGAAAYSSGSVRSNIYDSASDFSDDGDEQWGREEGNISDQYSDEDFITDDNTHTSGGFDYSREWRPGDGTGRAEYVAACTAAHIFPSSSLLAQLTSREVSLKDFVLGASFVRALAAGLAANTCTSILNLSGSGLKDSGLDLITRALLVNDSISSLDFSNNQGAALPSKAAVQLCQLVHNSLTLTHLSLAKNDFGDAFGVSFSAALATGTMLKVLDIGSNKLSKRTAVALAQAIPRNLHLTHLCLSWNNFADPGVLYLLPPTLGLSSKLRTLDLSFNGVTDAVAELLGRLLKANTVLTLLDLSHNRLGPATAESLAVALMTNKCLRCLKIGWNALGLAGTLALVKTLEKNNTLSSLRVENCTEGGTEAEIEEATNAVLEKRMFFAEVAFEYPERIRSKTSARFHSRMTEQKSSHHAPGSPLQTATENLSIPAGEGMHPRLWSGAINKQVLPGDVPPAPPPQTGKKSKFAGKTSKSRRKGS